MTNIQWVSERGKEGDLSGLCGCAHAMLIAGQYLNFAPNVFARQRTSQISCAGERKEL